MKKIPLILLLAAAAMPVLAQQTLQPATSAAAAGFSAARLQKIDSFFNAAVRQGYAPNAVTFVARNGRIVHHKAYGFSNLEKRTPAKTDDIFRIASQTKLITTIAAMMLYEEGRFFLDDPIEKYLPEFKGIQVMVSKDSLRAPRRQPTIRDLLTHTAGIPYGHPLDKSPLGFLAPNGVKTLDSLVKYIAGRPLLHDPGEKFSYGFNTDVAGRLVEVLSGKSLGDFMQERIFDPLGMQDTYFSLPAAKAGRLVELYSKKTMEDPLTVHTSQLQRTYPLANNPSMHLGGAGLVSTAADYAKICQLIVNGGTFNNKRLLSRKTVDIMGRNQIGAATVWDRNDKFGLGVQIITDSSRYGDLATPGSLTWGGAFCSEYTIDPKEKLILLVFTNVSPYAYYGEFVRKFRTLAYSALND
ncbi:serine hydrolase domain-containing protein [Chitinophaga lutea]